MSNRKKYIERELILSKLSNIRTCIETKRVYPSQTVNEVLSLDENCGDILFLKYLVYYPQSYYLNEILEDEDFFSNVKNIFHNPNLNFYFRGGAKTVRINAVDAFLNAIYSYLWSKLQCNRQSINRDFSDNRIVFHKINKILSFAEKTIKIFEDKIKINFATEYKQPLSDFKNFVLKIFSESKYWDASTEQIWDKKEQDDFERALNIRLTYFCSNIGLPEKIDIHLNYEGVRPFKKGAVGFLSYNFTQTPISITLFFPLFILAVLIPYTTNAYQLSNRKIIKEGLMEKILSGNTEFLLDNKNKNLLVTPINKKTESPVLLKDLENIETAKEELSKLFQSQEQFDLYIKTNLSMYLNPYLDYMEKNPNLTEEEINDFHNLFCKLKLILDKKINDLKNDDFEMTKIELKTIKDQVDFLLQENNIQFPKN